MQEFTSFRMSHECAAKKHVTRGGTEIIQNITGVGNDQACRNSSVGRGLFEHMLDCLSHEYKAVQVYAGIEFVNQGELGSPQHELQQFGFLQLAAGKPVVHVALEQMAKPQPLCKFGDSACRSASRADLGKLVQAQAAKRRRPLIHESDAQTHALVDGKTGNVLVLKPDDSACDLVRLFSSFLISC